jgi:putative flippase GtrA
VNRVRQWLRYGAVSIIATLTSMTVLGVLVSATTMPAGWANVIATAVGTVPSFELNRRWVWQKTGKRSFRGEVGPFWILSFAGLALSTLAVSAAAAWATRAGVDAATRTVVIEAANVATFGALWIAQFLILDRILFRGGATPVDPTGAPSSQGALR